MGPWGEVIGVVALACIGAGAGYLLSLLPKPYWLVGFIPPLLVVIALSLPTLDHMASFQWLTANRRENAVAAIPIAMMFFVTLRHLKTRQQRILVVLLAAVSEVYLALLPFLMPALAEPYFRRLEGVIDSNGVCIQSTDYTCVPAAAATALRRLGFEATEGEIAILARASRYEGTKFGLLEVGLKKRYGPQGLKCTNRRFSSIEELRKAGVTLISSKEIHGLGHCVAVLEVTDDEVIIGDPTAGYRKLSHEYFMKIWDGWGIALSREPVPKMDSGAANGPVE